MFTESSSRIKKCNVISQQGWTMEILQTDHTDIATSSNNEILVCIRILQT